MKKYYLFLSLIALLISSCEKDDFCIEPITPNMIVRFYNATNIAETKAVTDLTVSPSQTKYAIVGFVVLAKDQSKGDKMPNLSK